MVCPYCGALTVAAVGTQAASWQQQTGQQPQNGQYQNGQPQPGQQTQRPVPPGAQQGGPTATAPRPVATPTKPRSSVLPVLLVVLLLAVVAGGAWAYLNWDTVSELLPGATATDAAGTGDDADAAADADADAENVVSAYYASDQVVTVSASTTVEAYDADGNAFEGMTVRFSSVDASGAAGSVVAEATVQGGSFSVGAFSDLEPGTYALTLVDASTGTAYTCPDVLLVDETDDDGSDGAGTPAARLVLTVDPDDPTAATAATYSCEQVEHEVSLTIKSSSTGASTYVSSKVWTYPVFASSEESSALDELNEALYDEYAELLDALDDFDATDGATACVLYRATVTSLDDGLAGVRTEQVTTDGTDETTTVTGAIYNLSTGTRVSPESVSGLSSVELREQATAAIETCLAAAGVSSYDADAIEDIVASTSSYYLAAEGLVVIVAKGQVNASTYEVVVVPADGSGVEAGTDVAGTYY